MAKAKDLAALAGLAGLAYAYNKYKNKDESTTDSKSGETTSSKKDADDNDTLARVNKNMSPGQSAVDDTKAGVLKALTAPKAASNDKAPNQGVLSPKSIPPKAPPKPTVAKQAPSDPRLAEAGTSRGRPAVAKNPNYSNEGRSSTAPTSTPVATTTKVAEKPTTRSTNILEEAKEEARRRAAASQTTPTSTSSSTSPVTRTPFPGSSALNKKHGGAVKMASGGMTASRRGDGIAQRGKTRGKMC